jgi:hypothetical protein
MYTVYTRTSFTPSAFMLNLFAMFVRETAVRFVVYLSNAYMLYEMYYVFRIPEVMEFAKTQIIQQTRCPNQILQLVALAANIIQCVFIVLTARHVAANIEETQEKRRKIMMESKPEPAGFENPFVY